jgi:3-oxoacyl-[acyl-carrier-protein] synthase II
MPMHHAMGGKLLKGGFAPIRARLAQGGGMVPSSLGCFLVIESRAHAEARGARAIARIVAVASDRCKREPGQATAIAAKQLDGMAVDRAAAAVISGASGVADATAEELAFLDGLGLPVRATGTAVGHSLEPAFVANVALAAASVARGSLFAPLEAGEAAMAGALRQAVVTGWGHWRGEGMALVTQA